MIVSGWGSGGHPECAHAHVGCLIKYIMDQKNRYRNYTIYIYIYVCVKMFYAFDNTDVDINIYIYVYNYI